MSSISKTRPQEFVTASSTTAQQGGASANFVYSSATITLTAGIWLIQGMAQLYNTQTLDSHSIGLYNNTSLAEISNSRGAVGYASIGIRCFLLSNLVRIAVTSSTDIRVLCCRNGTSTAATNTTNANFPAVTLWGQRIG
jgi:hypothetical protein